jgi:DNA replication ATP-dependent helicase Dna2
VAELRRQYRMNADIMALCNTLVYDGHLRCGSRNVAAARLALPHYPHALRTPQAAGLGDRTACAAVGGVDACAAAGWLEHALSPNQPVLFLNTDSLVPGRRFLEHRQGSSDRSSSSRGGSGPVGNAVEAALVADLCAWLLRCGLPPEEFGVCSPYRAQLAAVKHELRRSLRAAGCPGLRSGVDAPGDWRSLLGRIEVKTVDKFQGRDKACLVVSTVHSNASGEVGTLLDDKRRVNVLLSRAKHKLLLVGSAATLSAAKAGGAAQAGASPGPGVGSAAAAPGGAAGGQPPAPRPSISADLMKLLRSKNLVVDLAPGAHEGLL